MLVEIEGHTVPHFKFPVYAKVELWGLECGGIFRIQTSLLVISHLLHKTGVVKTESVGNVESTQTVSVSTQSLHRAIQIYTESTQNNLLSTQSLHRAIQIYTESTQTDSVSTQSLHRAIHPHRTVRWSKQSVHRTMQTYTQSTQKKMGSTQSLHRAMHMYTPGHIIPHCWFSEKVRLFWQSFHWNSNTNDTSSGLKLGVASQYWRLPLQNKKAPLSSGV